jgi:hypothetical protein
MKRISNWRGLPVALCIAGAALLGLSWAFRSNGWFSGVLIGLGSTLLLFTPLLIVGRVIEKRLDSVRTEQEQSAEQQQQIVEHQQKTDSDIARLTEEVAHTQEDLRLTKEQLSDAVRSRIAATRDKDSALFESVADIPSRDTILAALCRMMELGLVSRNGCRVALFDTDLYLRFKAESSNSWLDDDDFDLILLVLERADGEEISRTVWEEGESPADIAVSIAQQMQTAGRYPGDARFNAGNIFGTLGSLLGVAHRAATSERGVVVPLGRIIQLCLPQWIIADDGIHAIEGHPGYFIHAQRFDEQDWYQHMHEKPWINLDSFDEAFGDANELYKARKLEVKPPLKVPVYVDEPPF